MAAALYSPIEKSVIDLLNERLEAWRCILAAFIKAFAGMLRLTQQGWMGGCRDGRG